MNVDEAKEKIKDFLINKLIGPYKILYISSDPECFQDHMVIRVGIRGRAGRIVFNSIMIHESLLHAISDFEKECKIELFDSGTDDLNVFKIVAKDIGENVLENI